MSVAPAVAQDPWPRPKSWTDLDRTLLQTTDVVTGALSTRSRDELRQAARAGGGYVRIPIRVDAAIRASGETPIRELTFFAAEPGHRFQFHPCEPELRRYLGHPQVLLMRRVGNRAFLAERFRNGSVFPLDRREEIVERVELHDQFGSLPVTSDDNPHRRRIAELLEMLLEADEEAIAAWRELDELPPRALPVLVAALEDARRIEGLRIPIVGITPQGQQELRWFEPNSIREVALQLLARRSGESLGSPTRDNADDGWHEVVRRWRIYAHIAELPRQLIATRR